MKHNDIHRCNLYILRNEIKKGIKLIQNYMEKEEEMEYEETRRARIIEIADLCKRYLIDFSSTCACDKCYEFVSYLFENLFSCLKNAEFKIGERNISIYKE